MLNAIVSVSINVCLQGELESAKFTISQCKLLNATSYSPEYTCNNAWCHPITCHSQNGHLEVASNPGLLCPDFISQPWRKNNME